MFNREEIEIIRRYIREEESDNEKKWVESLFTDHGEKNRDLRDFLEADWDNIPAGISKPDPKLDRMLDRIKLQIGVGRLSNKNNRIHRIVRIYMHIAAVLLLPVLIAGMLLLNGRKEHVETLTDIRATATIYAPSGSRVSFVLPDSTTGMLNGDSYITYNLPFNSDRKLKLEGEAWFEVAPDEDHPFEIQAGNSTIKVLGTSFNLNSNSEDNCLELVLVEGKVEFRTGDDQEFMNLNPLEKLSLRNGHVSRNKVDPLKYRAWTDGKLIFRGDLMAEVVRRLEKWYNVDIVIADSELERYSFRATFQDDSLDEVLECLAMTSPIGYRISPGRLLPDGTYKKKEIRIYKIRF